MVSRQRARKYRGDLEGGGKRAHEAKFRVAEGKAYCMKEGESN